VVTCVRTNALSGAAAAGWRPHPHAFPDLAVLMVSDFREVEERDVCCSWRAGAIYLFLPRRPAARSAAWAYVFNDPYSTINRMAAKAPQRMQQCTFALLLSLLIYTSCMHAYVHMYIYVGFPIDFSFLVAELNFIVAVLGLFRVLL